MAKAFIPSAEQQLKWVEIAESLRRSLVRTRRAPVSLVQMLRDPSAFQGWHVNQIADLVPLPSRKLGAGDSFILDFGQHCVGYFHLQLNRHGSGDSPTRLRLTFGEVPAEVAEPLDPYAGSLSRAWLQDEVINVDVVPATVSPPRRYAFRYVKVEVITTSGAFKVSVGSAWCDCVSAAVPLEDLPQPPSTPLGGTPRHRPHLFANAARVYADGFRRWAQARPPAVARRPAAPGTGQRRLVQKLRSGQAVPLPPRRAVARRRPRARVRLRNALSANRRQLHR